METNVQDAPRAIVTTSWDDADPLDLRLADMLSEHELPGTFYVSPQNRERAVMGLPQLRELAGRFEIGGHSLTHPPDLRLLSDGELDEELTGCKCRLEDVVGRPVEAFAYSRGRHDARVRGAVIAAGFAGARTAGLLHIAPPRDPWLTPTTLCARNSRGAEVYRHCLRAFSWPAFTEVARAGWGTPWPRLAQGLFERVLASGGVWHLWGHSWEIEQQGLWRDVHETLRAVSGRDGVSYLTNGQLMRMVARQWE